MTAKLACGCLLSFRAGEHGSPVTVVLQEKSGSCTMSIHVSGLPIYDHREALRPATRVTPIEHSDFEGEG